MKEESTDLTIREIRTTLLRMPWLDDPWLAGHALGAMRELVLVEVVTASGLVGMGYLHLLNSPMQRTIGTCIDDAMAPRDHRPRCHSGGGDLA